jgi:putative NADH-flavin reductase
MNVVLYGATGMIGSRILRELVSRGHSVTAVVRHPGKLPPSLHGVVGLQGDMLVVENVASTALGADAAVSAYGPGFETPGETLKKAFRSLVEGLKKAEVKRLIVVGGAGSLEVSPGVQLIDSPQFPEAWRPIAEAHRDAMEVLRGSGLEWTCLSPAAMIEPGVRTGRFRLGKDQLIVDDKGESRISAEDYAIALVDELEHPEHIRQRFTLGY